MFKLQGWTALQILKQIEVRHLCKNTYWLIAILVDSLQEGFESQFKIRKSFPFQPLRGTTSPKTSGFTHIQVVVVTSPLTNNQIVSEWQPRTEI